MSPKGTKEKSSYLVNFIVSVGCLKVAPAIAVFRHIYIYIYSRLSTLKNSSILDAGQNQIYVLFVLLDFSYCPCK